LSVRPGPRNLITDVEGLAVGNAADPRVRSGVTVVLAEDEAVAAVDVRGGGPGTRETDLLEPSNMVQAVQAICLSGGSAFGLDAATGVMTWLAERGRGFRVGPHVVPLVPAAILYDLENGGDKDWGSQLPYQALARAACDAAGADFALGTAGAGYGAKAGGIKGGLGSASAVDDEGLQVGAVVAVNARGAVTLPGQPQFWAWPFEQGAEFGALPPPTARVPLDPGLARSPPLGASTTIAVVASNAILSKAEARHVAVMAQDGLARAIRPVHTPFDGDTVFMLATGRHAVEGPRPRSVAHIGALAADCLARAVARGVYLAEGWEGLPSWREVYGSKP
jgi:L-aminopeptidase/D-esterase-like protein